MAEIKYLKENESIYRQTTAQGEAKPFKILIMQGYIGIEEYIILKDSGDSLLICNPSSGVYCNVIKRKNYNYKTVDAHYVLRDDSRHFPNVQQIQTFIDTEYPYLLNRVV